MEFMNPSYLWLILALPVFFVLWWFWGRRSYTLKNTQVARARVSTKLGATLTIGIWASRIALWTSLALAIAGSYFPFNRIGTDAAGIIYMTVDTSGSTVTGGVHYDYERELAYHFDKTLDPANKPPPPKPDNPGGYMMDQKPVPTRDAQPLDVELGAAKTFIEHSNGLRVGLTIFDDKFFNSYPATKNTDVAIDVLTEMRKYGALYSSTTGTNFDGPFDGRPNVGALQGALSVFGKESGNPTRIYIMLTDGMASIDDGRAKELAAAYKKLGIHFFVFGVDSQWSNLETPGLQPLIKFAKSVDGEVVSVQDPAQFKAALEKIDALAHSSIRTVYIKEKHDALLLLLAVALVSFALWLGLSALRRSSL